MGNSGRASIRSSLLSKRGAVAIAVAGDLLKRSLNDRINTVREYASELDASVGTIEAAFTFIESMDAVELKSRGRSGSFIKGIRYPVLWSIAHGRAIVGGLPLPWSRRIQGLATGIRLQCSNEACDLDLRYLRGSMNRISSLTSKSLDWALVSRFAAETAHAHGFTIDPVVTFGKDSYISNSIILFSDPTKHVIEDGMKVGIDRESTDHTYKVHSVCQGKQVRYVDIKYSQGLDLISNGEIDATIWSNEDLPDDMVQVNAVSVPTELEPALEDLSEAAIVTLKGNTGVSNVIRQLLDSDFIVNTQEEVVTLKRSPVF